MPSLELRDYFSQTFDLKWSPMFKEAAIGRILRIQVEELACVSCEELVGFIDRVGKVKGSFSEDMVFIRLSVSNLFLQTNNIKTRILGIGEINKIIEKHGQAQIYNDLKINDQTLTNYIRSLEIVKFLLNDSHLELIRKSFNLFVFLANQKVFLNEYIEIIWKTTIDNSAEEVFYELFLMLGLHLPEEFHSTIVSLVCSIDSHKSLKFLADFTKRVGKKSESVGISALFDKIFESNFKETAQEYFVEVVRSTKSLTTFYLYIDKLNSKILAGSSICDSLLTFIELMKINFEVYFSITRHEALVNIDEKFNGLWGKIDQYLNYFLSGEAEAENHKVNSVKVAMKLWNFIIKSSNQQVSIKKIQSFHELTLASPLNSAEEIFLSSLLKLVKRDSNFKLKEDLMFYFFLENTNTHKLTRQKFDLFYELFIQINREHNFLEVHGKEIYSRNSELLIGYEKLIDTLFISEEDHIYYKCLETIITLNMKLNRSIFQSKSKIWLDFLNIISENLLKTESCINRALNLLRHFLDKAKSKPEGPLNSIVKFYLLSDKDLSSFEVNDRTTTLGHIKEKLAEFYQRPASSIVLQHSSEIYNYLSDDRFLYTLKTPWTFLVNFDSRGHSMSPNEFLSQKEDFLMSILSLIKTFSSQNSALAWTILEKTWPIESIYKKTEDLLLPYEQLFPDDCLYTLVYNLKIIKKLVNNQNWLKLFKENSGFEYLIKLFIGFDIETKMIPSLALEFFSLILSLIKLSSLFPIELVDKILFTLIYLSRYKEESEMLINSCVYAKEILGMIQKTAGEAYQDRFSCYPLNDLVTKVLVNCQISILSGTISNFLLEHSNFTPSISSLIINELLSSIPLALKAENTDIYWGLVRIYINEIQNAELRLNTFNLLINELTSYPAEESSEKTDSNLLGLISVISIIMPNPAPFEIFTLVLNLIFEASSPVPLFPKCKSRMSKKEAFDLIKKLISQSPSNLNYFISNSAIFHNDLSFRTCRSSDWMICSSESEKSLSGYVGLKNLGCICYLNSCIQQLFCIEAFRDFILSYPSTGPESLMHELQFTFFALKNSIQQFFDPRGLCNKILDWEGKAINVQEQQDADEFINSFLDNILNQIPAQCFNIVQELLCGSFVTEIRGEDECKHFSRIQEKFFTLPVQVKGHNMVYDGLLDFVAGEVLEGSNAYQCDDCGKKVKAARRVLIEKLPKVLILTLRRFEFNFDMMKRVKINDFCEFPEEIDMKQFTLQELWETEEDYFKYRIKGVVVHLGTAESGHYYSYIRQGQNWFEFNDALVVPFDPSELKKETFGGYENLSSKSKSAYLLFYERVNYTSTLPQPGPGPSFLEVFHENRRFNQIRVSFSGEYIDFMLDLISKTSSETIQFCIRIFFTIIIRSSDFPRIVAFASVLKDLLGKSQEQSDWTLYLVSHSPVIKELFLDCPSLEKRKIMSGILRAAVKAASSEGLCMFTYKWLGSLPRAKVPFSYNFSNYFEVLLGILGTTPDLIALFNVQNRLLEFVNGEIIKVDHENIEETAQEEVLGYTPGVTVAAELSKSELGESCEYLAQCIETCAIYYEPAQLEEFCKEKCFMFFFENCKNKASCRCVAKMYLAFAQSDRKCFILVVQLITGKLKSLNSNELIQSSSIEKTSEIFSKFMKILYHFLMNFKPINPENYDQILNILIKISCNKLEKREDPYFILFYLKKMLAINLEIRKLAQKKVKTLKELETVLSNIWQSAQNLSKDLTRLKYCIDCFNTIRKLIKNEVKNYFIEDSDTELKDFEISPGSELLHYNHELSTWIKCTVTLNSEDLICIRYENSSVQKWLDASSDLLHRV